MTSTCSRDQELTEFTDNPERLVRERRRRSRMADTDTNAAIDIHGDNNDAETIQQDEGIGQPRDTQGRNRILEMYLPDLENTPLSEAVERGIQWQNNDEILVECPKLKNFYGADTLLVDKVSGACALFIGGEREDFALPCSLNKYPDTLLASILEADVKQWTMPKDLPGEIYTNIISEPISQRGLEGRLDAYAELCAMYAKNQIALQYAQLLPEHEKHREISKYTIKGRKIGTRMDELIAVFITDNTLRKTGGMRGYPIPTINPINKDINTKEQALRYESEAYKEVQEIMEIAYPPDNTATAATQHSDRLGRSTPMKGLTTNTVATMSISRPGRELPQRAPSPSFTMNTLATTPLDHLCHETTGRAPSPAFGVPGEDSQNPLTVRTSNDGPNNPFVVPTLATSR